MRSAKVCLKIIEEKLEKRKHEGRLKHFEVQVAAPFYVV